MKRTVLETTYFVVIPSSVLNAGSDFSGGLKEIVVSNREGRNRKSGGVGPGPGPVDGDKKLQCQS